MIKINSSANKAFYWSMLIGACFAIVAFISNWMGLIHQEESPTTYQLFDISFYYFTPLFSWLIITLVAIKTIDQWDVPRQKLRPFVMRLLLIVLLLSPFIRMFDILIDYSIKNVLGMINTNPFKILNDVWLVVLFSTPTAFFKILVILAIVYFFNQQTKGKVTLTVRTGDGTLHLIEKESIAYLQADGNYLNIKVSNESYRTRNTLKSFETKLGNDFHRIHKSTIINQKHIKQLKHWRNGEYLVIMTDDKPLTSGKTYKAAIANIKDQLISTHEVEDDPRSATVRPTVA